MLTGECLCIFSLEWLSNEHIAEHNFGEESQQNQLPEIDMRSAVQQLLQCHKMQMAAGECAIDTGGRAQSAMQVRHIGYMDTVAFDRRHRWRCACHRCHECVANDAHESGDTRLGQSFVHIFQNSKVYSAKNSKLCRDLRLRLRRSIERCPNCSGECALLVYQFCSWPRTALSFTNVRLFHSRSISVWANSRVHCWPRCVCMRTKQRAHTTKAAVCWWTPAKR